jgi:hypothetical protein
MQDAEIMKFNKIVAVAFGSDQDGEASAALHMGKKFLKDRNATITDFNLVSANSSASTEFKFWVEWTGSLIKEKNEAESALHSARADAEALRRERDELRAKLKSKSRVEVKRAQAKAETTNRELEELRASLEQTTAELRDAQRAMAETDAARRERDDLRTLLEQTRAELCEAHRAQADADADRRELETLKAVLEATRAELRAAHEVANALREAMASHSPADVADAVADTPTGRADAAGPPEQRGDPPACPHASDAAAGDGPRDWNPNFDKKAVGLYWRTVHAINADFEAGRLTKRQASGRRAAAYRSYQAGASRYKGTRTAKTSPASCW